MDRMQRYNLLYIVAALILTGCSIPGETGIPQEVPETVTEAAAETGFPETGSVQEDNDLQTEPDSTEEDIRQEAPPDDDTEQAPEVDYRDPSIFAIENGVIQYAPRAAVMGVLDDGRQLDVKNSGKYGVLQGTCTDGKYAYVILENQRVFTDEPGVYRRQGMIFKIDLSTWEITSQSGELTFNHGNDITYNSKTNKLYVANCLGAPEAGNLVSVVNPETLVIEDTIKLAHSIYGLSYSEEYDQYVAGINGSYDLVILDADFQMVRSISGINTGFLVQNVDCDGDYIYSAQCEQNSVVCYDWDGNYRGVYFVSGNYTEAESLFHVGDDFYMTFNLGGSGGTLYALDLDRTLLEETE